jgi:hypothetical protein
LNLGARNPTIWSDLSMAALRELAAPSTPPEVREEIERRIAAGEIVSAGDVKRIKYFFIGLRRNNFPRPGSHFGGLRSRHETIANRASPR